MKWNLFCSELFILLTTQISSYQFCKKDLDIFDLYLGHVFKKNLEGLAHSLWVNYMFNESNAETSIIHYAPNGWYPCDQL